MAKRIKSRYKICFQTQNKVWIYKNSRLRNFYKIRNKIVLLQGKFAKGFLITKNMKWTVIRRKMVPYIRVKNRFRFNYKNLFFTKQQLKNFYGGIQEYKLRNIFKKNWNTTLSFRRNVFIGALEQRINMVLFRMRLLPTIFACTQLIMHKGIFANEKLITLPSYKVKIGEIISIPEDQWFMFYKFVYERLYFRCFGKAMLYWRKKFILKKIQMQRIRDKSAIVNNFELGDEYWEYLRDFKKYKKIMNKLYLNYKESCSNLNFKKDNLNFKKSIKILIFFNIYLEKYLKPALLKLKKHVKLLRWWTNKSYLKNAHSVFRRMGFVKNFLYRVSIFIKVFYIKTLYINKIYLIKQQKLNKNIQKNLINNLSLIWKEFFIEKFLKIEKEKFKQECFLHQEWFSSYKRRLFLKLKSNTYKKRFFYRLRQLKYLKKKKKIFKNWCWHLHWYTPNYLEIDYSTLRCIFIYNPEIHEVFYGFPCSFNKIISFYKERSL